MLHSNSIDFSDEVEINKTNDSRECRILSLLDLF